MHAGTGHPAHLLLYTGVAAIMAVFPACLVHVLVFSKPGEPGWVGRNYSVVYPFLIVSAVTWTALLLYLATLVLTGGSV